MEARRLAQEAVARDPTYAYAWRMLATTEGNIFGNPYNDEYGDPATARRALDAAARAMQLAPTDGFAHSAYAVALYRNRQFEAADAEAVKALALAPNDASVLNGVGIVLSNAQQYEQAEALFRRSIALDPFSVIPVSGLGVAVYHQRRFTEAAPIFRDCMARAPTNVICAANLAAALGQLGLESEARAAARELERRSPGYTITEAVRGQQAFWRNSVSTDHFVEGLRKAGVPE